MNAAIPILKEATEVSIGFASNGGLRFHRVNAPTSKELNALVATISERVARYLERKGWLARDEQSDHLTLALDDVSEQNICRKTCLS